MLSTEEALVRLKEGNNRFVAGLRSSESLKSPERRKELAGGQNPFAIILGCSDSRVPVELVFDQGLGDLFVIRVAGNIAGISQIGSVEYAAEKLGARLVVVLGHSQCGAVTGTVKELKEPSQGMSENLHSIVEFIRPSVEPLIKEESENDLDHLVERAVRANVKASIAHLQQGSETLEQLICKDKLLIVGAEYSLETGIVDFFDDVE